MKTLSDVFLVIATIASMAVSALGFSIGAWGGFWGGAGVGAVLGLLLWLVPTLSIFAFASYLISRPVGLICAWAFAFSDLITSICSLVSGESTRFIFLLSVIQLIACLALEGDARIQKKLAHHLEPVKGVPTHPSPKL